MIHYNLHCQHGHEFEGWFTDSAGFDRLAKRGLVECPECGNTQVKRALMAPAVAKRSRAPEHERAAAAPPSATPAAPAPKGPAMAMAGGPVPDQVRALLQRMRAEVEKNCTYVGPDFAEEARKMHRGESDQRGIYGETTPTEADALREEGIEFSRIPWVPRADA
jgi:hypothetical protein